MMEVYSTCSAPSCIKDSLTDGYETFSSIYMYTHWTLDSIYIAPIENFQIPPPILDKVCERNMGTREAAISIDSDCRCTCASTVLRCTSAHICSLVVGIYSVMGVNVIEHKLPRRWTWHYSYGRTRRPSTAPPRFFASSPLHPSVYIPTRWPIHIQ